MSAETATISVATSRDTSAMRGMKDGVSTRAAAATGLVKKKVVTIVTPLPEGFRALKGVKITPWKPDMSKCKVCDMKFTIFNHRHKCRNCQEPVCNPCARSRKVLRAYTPAKRICDTCIDKFWAPKPQKPTSTTTATATATTTTSTTPASIEEKSSDAGFPLTISPDDGECRTDAQHTAPMSPGTPAGFFMSPHHRNNNNATSGQGEQTAPHFRHKSRAVLDLTALVAPTAAASPPAPMLSPPTPAGHDAANTLGTPSSARGWGVFFGSNDNSSSKGGGVEAAAAEVAREELVVEEAVVKEQGGGGVCCGVDGRGGGGGVVEGGCGADEEQEKGVRAESSAVVVENVEVNEEFSLQAKREEEEEDEPCVEVVPIASVVAQEVEDVEEEEEYFADVEEDDVVVGLPLLLENGEEKVPDDEAAFHVPEEKKQQEEEVQHVDAANDDVLLASWPAPLPAVPEELASEVEEEEEDEVRDEEEEEFEHVEVDEKRHGMIILPFVTGLSWSLVAVGTGLAIAMLVRMW